MRLIKHLGGLHKVGLTLGAYLDHCLLKWVRAVLRTKKEVQWHMKRSTTQQLTWFCSLQPSAQLLKMKLPGSFREEWRGSGQAAPKYAIWHTDDFVLKSLKQPVHEGHSDPPLSPLKAENESRAPTVPSLCRREKDILYHQIVNSGLGKL